MAFLRMVGWNNGSGEVVYSSENRSLEIQILKSYVCSLSRNSRVRRLKCLGPVIPPILPTDNTWERMVRGGVFEAHLVPAGPWLGNQLGQVGPKH